MDCVKVHFSVKVHFAYASIRLLFHVYMEDDLCTK